MNVNWTHQAVKSFNKNIEWLEKHWTIKEIENFINDTEIIIKKIAQNPAIFAQSEKKKTIRKGSINKIVSIFYRIHPKKKSIDILLFWDNRQNPDNLKY